MTVSNYLGVCPEFRSQTRVVVARDRLKPSSFVVLCTWPSNLVEPTSVRTGTYTLGSIIPLSRIKSEGGELGVYRAGECHTFRSRPVLTIS